MTVTWFEDNGTLRYKPDEWWPQLNSLGEYADFSYDATDDIAAGDSIVGLTLTVAPSGPGEAVMSRLQLFQPYLVSVWITGGVPGRTYLYALTISTKMLRAIPIMIGQQCAAIPSVYPPPPPVNPGFGALITWTIPASQT